MKISIILSKESTDASKVNPEFKSVISKGQEQQEV